MPVRFPLTRLAGWFGVLGLAGAALAVPASPASAAGGTDLTVTLTSDPAAPRAGRHVAYRIKVRNLGPATATKVSVDFVTTTALASPTASVSTGHCLRSPAETACLFGTLPPGGTAWATIGGVLPGHLAPGTVLKNSVTVASDTPLTDPAHSVATTTYTVPGGTATAPVPAADPVSAAPAGTPAAAPATGPGGQTGQGFWTLAGLGGLAAIVLGLGLGLILWLRARRRPSHPRPTGHLTS